MATRSNIAIFKKADKQGIHEVEYIYCHFDGYPSGVGATLLESYQDIEKVRKLIALGDISYLEKEVDIPEGVEHSFNKPIDGITVAYGRDRGETGTESRKKYIIDKDRLSSLKEQEYLYVYDEEQEKWLHN